MTWSDTLSDNGIMMEEGEAAKAIALGVSEKTALSGSTTSVDVSGMCSSLFAPIDWGFCDAVDQVISVIAPRFVNSNNTAYSSDIGELISVAGFTTAVYGATNGEVRLRGGGMLFDSEWIKQRKGVLNLFVNAGVPVANAPFTRTSLNSNTWTVTGSSVTGATTTLSHSLNAIGSTVTPTSYFRGTATYSTNITLDASKRYYLYLGPVYQRADVMLNGSTVSTLEVYGATAAQHVFTEERPGLPVVIDLTDVPFANGGNTLSLTVDNASTYYYIPFNGLVDCYNMVGNVSLWEAGKLCFDPMVYGTRRCHLVPTSTGVVVKVAVKSHSNQSDTDYGWITANVYISGDTTSLANASSRVSLQPGSSNTYEITLNINTATVQANTWSIGSGSLFKVTLQLQSDTATGNVDTIEDYFGYREFSAGKHNSTDGGYGLTLNGSTMSLYGVGYHHWDRMPTTDEMDADWEIITALKPKMVRFAYFPAMHYLLNKCDREGIAAMIEIPWMHDFHKGDWDPGNAESYRNDWRLRYQHNTTANAVAMIKEFYNHPSVLFYCIGTGFGVKTYHEWKPDQMHTYITNELLPAVRSADSSRLVCIELASTNSGYGIPASWTDVGDIILERMNSGWGSGSISGVASEANTWNGSNSTVPMAILDWSYGANPENHVEWSSASTKPSDTGINNAVDYPEEYQAYCVEQYASSGLALNWPVFNLYGTVFDYAASNVSAAGGKSGVMQTGLVTRDRSILKDAYYYLKAMWNSEPMVYVTQKRNMNKETSPITLRIYTNCEYVKVYSSSLTLLDTVLRSSGSYAVTTSVELEEGGNIFYVTGHDTSSGEATCNDSVLVNYEDTSGTAHILIYSDSAIVNSGKVNAAVLPNTEPQGITWSSDTPTIATVNSGGTVTVLLDGTATIRATSTSDNTITKTKAIPCYIRGATDSLYYKVQQYISPADEDGVQYRGVSVYANDDGSITLDGTIEGSGNNYFILWPNAQNGNHIVHTTRCMFPVWNITGDQLLTAEVIGGTITGTPTGDPFTLVPVDQTYTELSQASLKPLNEVNGNGDVRAKLIASSDLGFSSWKLRHSYPVGTVFDNVVLRIQSFKQANSFFNGGLLESHFPSVNTLVLHKQQMGVTNTLLCNMLCRNADGSFSETVANPNAGAGVPPYGRLTDGFAFDDYAVPLSGSTIATAGTVLKFTAIMKNWPGNYQNKAADSEWAFLLWYADGTQAAKLTWAYGDNGSGVDFTGGTASTTFIAEKTVDCASWHYGRISWGNTLDLTATVSFYLKLEEVDPTNVPPNSISVYTGGDRIVNSGLLGAVCDPLSANQSVTWSSSNTNVATIDSSTGMVTVVSDGQCTFTATSTLDNSKTGSATVTCYKPTTSNLVKNIFSVKDAQNSQTYNGVTLTNNKDGTYVLGGTTSAATVSFKVAPLTSSNNTYITYFPIEGIAGDLLIWAEYVSGTISELTTSTSGGELCFNAYDISNTKIDASFLPYKIVPSNSTDKHSVLITGSTTGIRRIALDLKFPVGTVFDNLTFRLGVEKKSSLGNVYSGGVVESYLAALNSFYAVSSKGNPMTRFADGSFFLTMGNSLNWSQAQSGAFTLTGTPAFCGSLSGIPKTTVIAASGKTYKLSVQLLTSPTFDTASMSSDSTFYFAAIGANGTELAKLIYYAQSDYTTGVFTDGVGEVTFTASENVVNLYFYFAKIKTTNTLRFGISLTEVTT